MKLAQNSVSDIFGRISPPPGTPSSPDPIAGLSKLLSVALQLVLTGAALLLLIYMLMGAVDWLASQGEKEKIVKAQQKIFNAIIGMLMVVVSFTIFTVITGTILGNKIIDTSGGGWRLIIPTIAP